MSRIIGVAVAIAAVAAVGAVSFWAGHRAGSTPDATPASATASKTAPGGGVVVEATRVSLVKLPQALTAVGSLRSDETVIVRPEVAGRISRILFREGERVSKGQVLVKLDDSVQKADLDKASANLVLSRTKYERSVDLRAKGFLSSQAQEESENNLKVAQADKELMEARLAKTAIR